MRGRAGLASGKLAQVQTQERRPGPERGATAAKGAPKRGTLGDIFRGRAPAPTRPDIAAPRQPNPPTPGPSPNPPARRGWRPGRGRNQPTPPSRSSAFPLYFPPGSYGKPVTPPAPPTPPPIPPSGTWGDSSEQWDAEPYPTASDFMAPDIADEVEGEQGADAGSWGSGWSVVQEQQDIGPRRPSISGSLSASRAHGPMVPLDEINKMQVPQYIGALPPIARSRGRRVLRRANTAMFNLVVIGLVLGILAIPVVIGLHHIAASQPRLLKSSPAALPVVPTPQLAQGFSGFINKQFSIAYPSDWTHTSSSTTLADGTPTHIEDFVGQGSQEVIVGTAAVPDDELSPLVDAAAQLKTQQAVMGAAGAGLNRNYDGQRWIENDYTFTRVQGTTTTQIEVRALAVDVGATTYFVVAYGPQKTFASTNATYIEPMLASFRFQ